MLAFNFSLYPSATTLFVTLNDPAAKLPPSRTLPKSITVDPNTPTAGRYTVALTFNVTEAKLTSANPVPA
jgi:hypothetical protein